MRLLKAILKFLLYETKKVAQEHSYTRIIDSLIELTCVDKRCLPSARRYLCNVHCVHLKIVSLTTPKDHDKKT